DVVLADRRLVELALGVVVAQEERGLARLDAGLGPARLRLDRAGGHLRLAGRQARLELLERARPRGVGPTLDGGVLAERDQRGVEHPALPLEGQGLGPALGIALLREGVQLAADESQPRLRGLRL